MSLDANVLAQTALENAVAAAKGHGETLKTYLEQRSKIIAQSAYLLAEDRRKGLINDEQVRFAWQQLKETERAARLAVQFIARAALQDAVNAALAVAAGAFNQAIGFKLL